MRPSDCSLIVVCGTPHGATFSLFILHVAVFRDTLNERTRHRTNSASSTAWLNSHAQVFELQVLDSASPFSAGQLPHQTNSASSIAWLKSHAQVFELQVLDSASLHFLQDNYPTRRSSASSIAWPTGHEQVFLFV